MDFKLGSQSRNGSNKQAASRARLKTPNRTKNVNELQVAVMQWELTLVEHESKFSEVLADSVKTAKMRAIASQECGLRDFSTDFSIMNNFKIVFASVEERLMGRGREP